MKVRITFACGGTLDSMPIPLDTPWGLQCPACEGESAIKVTKIEIVDGVVLSREDAESILWCAGTEDAMGIPVEVAQRLREQIEG